MKKADFNEMFKNMVKEEMQCFIDKGEEYTVGKDDALTNFKEVAKEVGITPLQAWYVFFNKHIRSIASYVKTGSEKSNEAIECRIMDARNYLALGRGLIQEHKEAKND